MAPARRRDGPGDDPLAFLKALHRRTERLDDANRLMANRQPFGDRIFAFQDMHVRSVIWRCRNADQRILRANIWYRFVVENYSAFLNEYCRFHHLGHVFLPLGLCPHWPCSLGEPVSVCSFHILLSSDETPASRSAEARFFGTRHGCSRCT